MHHHEAVDNSDENKNGQFLATIEAQAAHSSPFGEAVAATSKHYFEDGGLSFALNHLKEQGIDIVSDYWQNSALDAIASDGSIKDFDDTTSNGQAATQEEYINHGFDNKPNPLNEDKRFPGMRPNGFEIDPDTTPTMAIVALDPTRLDGRIDDNHKAELREELNGLRVAVMKNGETKRELSPHLKEILSNCLLSNNTSMSGRNAERNVVGWKLPYDKIASIKALYTLLSGEETSSSLRQGAIKATSPDGKELIVGASGMNSAVDEMVARNFAADVFAQANPDV